MKLEVYGSKKLKEEEPVKLMLVPGDGVFTNGVAVIAVDGSGKHIRNGKLITFQENGGICRCCNVNPDLGFRLDKYGRIDLTGG